VSDPARMESDPLIGVVLASRYQIEVRLGEGAMGSVYKARHVKVGRAFAVKVLHPKLLEDGKVAQRFEREAELAGRLRHPNVVGVVDVGETTDGLRYMVMDFAEGPDLATLMDDTPFTGARVVHLTRQMLEGLFHAHEQGLIHRDFKPENVIIEKDTHGAEMPRIVDFGIAILREGGDSPSGEGRLTTNGLVLGTPHYMAPEQAVADPIDHRIDLFALGIVMYEMLSGKLPFDGTGAEVARANLLLDPPPIALRVPHLEVDPLLEAFARRLMAKKRDARPPTAKAARDLLDLIERDRDAAAAALGVPLASVRGPAPTAPSAPLPRHGAYQGNDTFPPPFAQPPNDPVATAPAFLSKEFRDKPTESMQPVAAKRPVRLLIGIGAALLAAAIVFAMTRGSSDRPASPVQDQPVLASAPDAAVAAPPVIDAAVEQVASAPDAGAVAEPRPKLPTKTPKHPTSKIVLPAAGSGSGTSPVTPDVKVEVKPPLPEVKPAGPLDANGLMALWKSVGEEVRRLGVDSDPFAQFRLIRIQDHLRDPADIAATEKRLRAIRAQAADLAKRP